MSWTTGRQSYRTHESTTSRWPGVAGGTTGLLLAALLVCVCLLVWFERGKDEFEQHQSRSRVDDATRARRAKYRHAGQGLTFELETGAIGPGHALADITTRFPPARIDPYRRFARVLYRDGDHIWIDLWVRDGQVVEAYRFGESTDLPADREGRFADEFFRMTAADRATLTTELTTVTLRSRDAHMAAGGPLGYIAYYEPPRPAPESSPEGR